MDPGALADQEPFTAWLRRGIGRDRITRGAANFTGRSARANSSASRVGGGLEGRGRSSLLALKPRLHDPRRGASIKFFFRIVKCHRGLSSNSEECFVDFEVQIPAFTRLSCSSRRFVFIVRALNFEKAHDDLRGAQPRARMSCVAPIGHECR